MSRGSAAHITMLESIGLLTQEELQTLLSALEEIKETIRNGSFSIEEGGGCPLPSRVHAYGKAR